MSGAVVLGISFAIVVLFGFAGARFVASGVRVLNASQRVTISKRNLVYLHL